MKEELMKGLIKLIKIEGINNGLDIFNKRMV